MIVSGEGALRGDYEEKKINLVRLLTTILVEKIFQFLVQGTISILYDIRELFVSKFLP